MPNFRQQAQDLARQMTAAIAEARFWQQQAEQQIASEDQRVRTTAEAARQNALAAAASQRATILAGLTTQRDQELAAALAAYNAVLDPLPGKVNALAQELDFAARRWDDAPGWRAWQPVVGTHAPAALRAGELAVKGQWHSLKLPALLPIIGSKGALLFQAADKAKPAAAQAMQALAARLLATLPPGKLRFTFVDPVGLGQNVAAFMKLADYDENLVTSKAWSEPHQIEQQLAALNEQMENVIQKYLRAQFKTIEEYNAQAGEVAEPYRVLMVFDFPANFTEASARRLVSIAQNGPRCGVYTIVLVDTSKPLPYGFTLADLEQGATVIAWDGQAWRWRDEDFQQCTLTLDEAPPIELLDRIVETVGKQARKSSEVKVSFTRIAPPRADWWRGYRLDGTFVDTAESLRVKLGPAGASKVQELALGGKGTSQHALLVGRTGSGKSTLLHTLITNLALTYSPDEVQVYLIDFKKGVEFQSYARARLPHARVVAIESEREFGLSVLQGLKKETDDRGALFTSRGVANIAEFRSRTGKPLPRLLLLVDEFQIFFAEDDAIASQAAQIIDHLVRQGRAFGVHVILASQTLAGSYALPRTTVDQMGVRIALQCSDADSRLILSDDNPAARQLERPGQAIYNTANGRPEGNNFFQVAYLDQETDELEHILADLRAFADAHTANYIPFEPIIFEGNVPGKIEKNLALANLMAGKAALSKAPVVWLGDPVAIRDAVMASFRKQSGANLLVIGQNEEAATGLFSAALLALAAQVRDAAPAIHLLDFSQGDDATADFYNTLAPHLSRPIMIAKRRQMADLLTGLADEVKRRLDDEGGPQPPRFLLVHGLQRARDLRQEDSFSSYSSFSDEPAPVNSAQQFARILRDGPEVGVHTLVWCDTVTNLNRALERRLLREFALRVAFQMSAEDSSTLLDSPAASKVGPNRAYLYSEDEGRLEKFRPYGLPPLEWLALST